MSKLLLGILLLIAFTASAQDLQTVQRSIAANDYLSAKQQIDSFFSDKKNWNDAPAWYYKGRVYTEIVRQHDKKNYETLQQALDAYKRYQALDAKNKLMQLNDNVDLFQLYDLSYNTGADFYNDKNYILAFQDFKIALDAETYISAKGFAFQGKTFPSFDTSLINLTGSAAYLAGREEESIPYFERLANAKISGSDYKGVYALLYRYYSKQNDAFKASKFLSAGKELFTDDNYWIKLELGNASNNKERFTLYDQLLQKYPNNFNLLMDYAVELFNYVYADARPSDFDNRQNRLQILLAKAINADPNSALANFVMSQHVYNQVYDMEETLSTMKDDTQVEQTKKKNFSARLDQKYEELLLYSKKAFDLYSQNLTAETKGNCRKVITQLIVYYQKKKQTDKVNYYQQQLKAL